MEISVREIAFAAAVSSGEKYISRRLRALIGHQAHSSYQHNSEGITEYYIKFPVDIDDWKVLIRGRVDVVVKDGNSVRIEEIKSTTQRLKDRSTSVEEDLFDEAYQLQLQIYSHYFYEFEGFSKITATLVFIDPVNEEEYKLPVNPRPMGSFLQSFLSQTIKTYVYEQEVKEELRKRVSSIIFPFDNYRTHQQDIMTRIEDNLESSRLFILHAPPGIGKTITTLYPYLKYAIGNSMRLFTVTSKTTQQLIYKETFSLLQEHGAEFKAIRITAKGKMCKTDTYDCYDNDCPYFENYLATDTRDSISRILELDMIDRKVIEQRASLERICPFELSLDVAMECDVILSDFNYIFHPRVKFQRFQAEFDNSLLIIDEAHNLVDRSRDYYSDTLSIAEIEEVVAFVRTSQVSTQLRYQLRSHLKRIIRYIQRMKDQIVSLEADHSIIKIDYEQILSYQDKLDLLAIEYLNALSYIPEKKDVLIKFTDKLKFFTLLLKESEAEEFEHIYDLQEKQIRIFCTSAARKLSESMALFDSVIAQSATLQPMDYYQHMLGMDNIKDLSNVSSKLSSSKTSLNPSQDQNVSSTSSNCSDTSNSSENSNPTSPDQSSNKVIRMEYTHPFEQANRLYLVDTSLSTTYRERLRFFDIIAEHIVQLIQLHQGNYLAFFPSFKFLQQVLPYLEQYLQSSQSSMRIIIQTSDMTDDDRGRVLTVLSSKNNTLLLAVMGGVFSEGIDYKGDMAVGAFIISPALPQINFDNELIKQYFDSTIGQGFDYAYKYPGMAKVIQAAGRVFRSESDRGFVVFMGHRFSTDAYYSLFPEEYNVEVGDISFLTETIARFWNSHSK